MYWLSRGRPPYSVFDLARIRGEREPENLYDHKHPASSADLQKDFTLTASVGKPECTWAQSGEPIIDRAGIREALQKLSYPLYFLDYETFSPAIPLFDGYSAAYQQMVFHGSLHVLPSRPAS